MLFAANAVEQEVIVATITIALFTVYLHASEICRVAR